ncbi:hypothetical protein G7K_0661-t1 [Saitoella complicata NRRL Y-17804]|uniref:Uncharacterized protein n=1 Tax=Saitoella complicata (strain BCRC 22490 / CBS 7301 / JCM 7358 / NBRC 10748 / NRRL Y-17804) TaxID=698492 RepID=A0A0E9NAK4_SAICN|nr:hypothetical protein G7K_0661-t1 [Saitoella complicata NRRL Y-17804]
MQYDGSATCATDACETSTPTPRKGGGDTPPPPPASSPPTKPANNTATANHLRIGIAFTPLTYLLYHISIRFLLRLRHSSTITTSIHTFQGKVVIYDFYFCSTLLYSTLVYDFLDSHSTTIIYTYTTTLTKQTNNMQLITAFTSTSCLFPHLSLPHPFSSTSTPSSPTFASPSTLFAPTHNTSRVFCLFTLPLRLAYSASTLPFRVIRAAGAVLEGENGDAWLEADLGVDEDVEGKKKEKVLKKVRFRGVDIFRKQLSDFRFSSAPSSSLAEVEHDVCWGELGCMTLLPSDFVHLGASTQIFVDQCWAELRRVTLSTRDCNTSTPSPNSPRTTVIDSTTAVHHAPYALTTSPVSDSSSAFASAEISSLGSSDVFMPAWCSDSERSEEVVIKSASELEVDFGVEMALVLERGVETPVTPFLRPFRAAAAAAAAEVDLELISPMTSILPSTLSFTPAMSSLPTLTSASEVESEVESHSVPWFDPTLPQFRPSSNPLSSVPTSTPSLTLDIRTPLFTRHRSAKRHVESADADVVRICIFLEMRDESVRVLSDSESDGEREKAPMSLKGLMGFAGLQSRSEEKKDVQETVKEVSVIDGLLEDLRMTPLRRKTKSSVRYKDADVCILGPFLVLPQSRLSRRRRMSASPNPSSILITSTSISTSTSLSSLRSRPLPPCPTLTLLVSNLPLAFPIARVKLMRARMRRSACWNSLEGSKWGRRLGPGTPRTC